MKTLQAQTTHLRTRSLFLPDTVAFLHFSHLFRAGTVAASKGMSNTEPGTGFLSILTLILIPAILKIRGKISCEYTRPTNDYNSHDSSRA